MTGFWDEKTSEFDMLQDNMEDSAQEILDELEEEDLEEEYEEEYEEEEMSDYSPTDKKVAYKLNKRENTVVTDAMIRLEQARLYDMLIKHDLFKGVKAHPRALTNVQAELKSYIVNRLEILLGIKAEKVEKETPKQVSVELPFNDIEIEFLKALSYKGTKGASAQADSKKVVATEVMPTIAAPVQDEPQGLQSLAGSVEVEDVYGEEEEYEEPPKPRKRVAKKKPAPKRKAAPKRKPAPAQQPAKKTKASRAKMNRKGQISDAEAERLAREDIDRMQKYNKPAHEMNVDELMEANKSINTGKVKAQGTKPIPTGAQLDMHYRTKQMNQQADPKAGGFNVLLNKILADKG